MKRFFHTGGVGERPFKLITRDDKFNPGAGLELVKVLLLSEKADFLTGTITTAETLNQLIKERVAPASPRGSLNS